MDRAADQPAPKLPADYSELITQRELLRQATQRLVERLRLHNRAERPQATDVQDNQGVGGEGEA